MLNECITENLVRNNFSRFQKEGFIIEENKSKNNRINKLLQFASKKGNKNGLPDFLVRHEEDENFLMVVECKADVRKHKSKTLDKYSEYAVDGALLYSSYLAKEFDVLALGVSGQTRKELQATSFLQLKTNDKPEFFTDEFLTLPAYKNNYLYKEETKNQRYEELLEYNKELNQLLHSNKIKEDKRSLLISGILIALENRVFKDSFSLYTTAQQLASGVVNSIVDQLQLCNIPETKIQALKQAYAFIKTNKTLSSDKTFFINLIKNIDKKINSFSKTYRFYDLFGEFYTEFLRYANSDKGLGIVLTPKHITELFCELSLLTKDSVVFNNCCGTGGFLISAMRMMMQDEGVKFSNSKKEKIKQKQIVGIEYQDDIFPLACSNMIIHGDGKSNIYNEDCFKIDIKKEIRKNFHPTVGLLNPPFKTDKNDKEELEFVLNNLEGLETNALCVALLPMQCALVQNGSRLILKEKIMKEHTLEAVISLPDEVFYNSKVSVVTCAIIIRAHQPHPKNFSTYFGYWKNDGFVKRKNKGRIDSGEWIGIKRKWIDSYINKQSVPGLSIMQPVIPKDEWCAEAYIETDYNKLTKDDFIKTIKNHVNFLFSNEFIGSANNKFVSRNTALLNFNNWKTFKCEELFDIKLGKPIHKEQLLEGKIPYITRTANNNGVDCYGEQTSKFLNKGNSITIGAEGILAFYQRYDFIVGNKINILSHKRLNKYNAIFLCTILNYTNIGRFNYGYAIVQHRLKNLTIKIPADLQGNPDWQFMEDYIKSLPYSSSL